jgi:hypothetical protein
VIRGAIESITVTENEPAAVLPWTSAAEQRTSVVPSANNEPETGVQDAIKLPSTRSVAAVENMTFAPVERVASRVMFVGS